MPSESENAPLLPTESPRNYYFLKGEKIGGSTTSVLDVDGGEEIDIVPEGTTKDDFASRAISPSIRRKKAPDTPPPAPQLSLWQRLFGRSSIPSSRNYGEIGTLVRERKVPIKIEPKVFFANERTFLAWLHASVLLAGASVAIVAFADDSNPWSQLYGIIQLPVAISFICYSMYQYARRAAMIRRKDPGPYEDTVGPTVLGIMLMLSILAQFAIKVYTMM
mmetsp:Transcript_7971/g.12205  ORF Transcript_7971/g.12205 Transcript_7971/m.12205 type:complete len:220 (+) Transcript_7971:99-758(+)|eukprot:CAMPEP_0178922340 /NCGR_PEP_ID=MMETSP0786-20121207/16096_1 /TAXON_ID=186022 /ORGANISM="Thalassionema frauenfeldii, Strain CCMP 1798" /LENGTH=219 /DNA_ID=CAMNT_0020596687 /DNA_START=92 /DNA_END=751 /DNA_ORIENTATION=-